MKSDLRSLSKGINGLLQEIEYYKKNTKQCDNDQFSEKFESFSEDAKVMVTDAESRMEMMGELFDEVCSLFGEDSKKIAQDANIYARGKFL